MDGLKCGRCNASRETTDNFCRRCGHQLTVNLPAVTRVQILVDGKEVDTLAGHVDLRHPLAKSLEWVVNDTQ